MAKSYPLHRDAASAERGPCAAHPAPEKPKGRAFLLQPHDSLLHMRWPMLFAVASLGVCWGTAAWFYPGLPAQFPVHFALDGTPDRFAAKTPGEWFLLPSLVSGLHLLFALVLPWWIQRLAARNSPFLNLPDKAAFAALPTAARVRAVLPVLSLLQLLAAEITLLFAWILFGTAKVAAGAWNALPAWMPLLAIPGIAATGLCALPLSRRAIARERAAASHP